MKSKHGVISIVIGGACLLLLVRLFTLTVVQGSTWLERSDNLSIYKEYDEAQRGDILDRNGNVLATSQLNEDGEYVRVYPYGSTASHILGYLGRISEEEKEDYVDKGDYQIDTLVGKSGIEKSMESTLKGTDGITSFRINSAGTIVNSLGTTAATKGEDVTLSIDIELQQVAESALEEAITKANAGATFESKYGNIQMTEASNLETGAAVVLDVKTGQVLAMASYPDFDPNDFAQGITQEKWESYQRQNTNDSLSAYPLYNVATMTSVQPGSTFKPVTALAALSAGLDSDVYIKDEGVVTLGDRTYGCHLWNKLGTTHGYLNLNDAMKVSCNYYFYKTATENTDSETIVSYAQKMGLGSKTGIELAESSGKLPTAENKLLSIRASLKNYLLSEREEYFTEEYCRDEEALTALVKKITNWCNKGLNLEEIASKLESTKAIRTGSIDELSKKLQSDYFNQVGVGIGDLLNTSIGQGDNAYTPIQMANYMATLGDEGRLKGVSILLSADSETTEDSQVISQCSREDLTNIDTVLQAMKQVTTSRGGSLQGVFAGFPYETLAKTGTAQRAGFINVEDEENYLRVYLHLIAPDVSYEDVIDESERLTSLYPEFYRSNIQALRRAIINLSSYKITADDIDRFKETYDNFAWTVALAPADDPEIAIAVMLVQGVTATNSAPVVREIIGSYGESKGWDK